MLHYTAFTGIVLRPSMQRGTGIVLATLFCGVSSRTEGLNRFLASKRNSGYNATAEPSVVYTNLSQVSLHASFASSLQFIV